MNKKGRKVMEKVDLTDLMMVFVLFTWGIAGAVFMVVACCTGDWWGVCDGATLGIVAWIGIQQLCCKYWGGRDP